MHTVEPIEMEDGWYFTTPDGEAYGPYLTKEDCEEKIKEWLHFWDDIDF